MRRFLLHRWPTALALTVSALTWDAVTDDTVVALADVLPMLPLLYLLMAGLNRPRLTWPLLGAGIAAVVLLRLTGALAPSVLMAAIALVVLLWPGGRSGELGLQTLGMVFFGALAAAGLILDPHVGRYLVAAGWGLHGIWDGVHLVRRRVVAPSFAEWCGVVDVLIAAQLLFLA
jgi:hypothetical protein